MILLRPICWLLGHRRGREVMPVSDGSTDNTRIFQARVDGMRLFRCPRCSRETRYKVKSKSADVVQIPVGRT